MPTNHSLVPTSNRLMWPTTERRSFPVGKESEWRQCVQILRKHWKLSGLCSFMVFAAVAAFTFMSTRIYESTARLEIDPPGSETFTLERGKVGSLDSDYLDTQSELLQSEWLAVAVIRKLQLDQNQIFVGKDATPDESGKSPVKLTARENLALRYYQGHLTVTPAKKSRVLEVKFATPDPQLSALVVNTHADLFIERSYQARYDAVMHASEWLARQMDDIRDKASKSAATLATYQKQHGIVDVDEKQSSVGQKVSELNRQLAQASTDRIQFEAYLQGLNGGHQDSLPQIRDNPMLQALRQRLIENKADLSQLQIVYGEKNPNVQKLESNIKELESLLKREERTTVSQIQTSFKAAQVREDMLASEIRGVASEISEVAEYAALKKQAESDVDLYNTLYTQVKEAGIAAASKSSNARLVDAGRVLDKPTRPRTALNLAVGLVLSVVVGFVFAFVSEATDNRIRTSEDVRKATGYSLLTLLPTRHRHALKAENHDGARALSFFDNPYSHEAEALRELQTSVLLSDPNHRPQVLLIVSPASGDGKTTVAINLATALSNLGNTCLVDADLRKPGIAAGIGVQSDLGLNDILNGSVQLADAIVESPQSRRLVVLPAGGESLNGVVRLNIDELLFSKRMNQVLRSLRYACQYVVIDTPPLIPYADARALSSLVDGVILVGRYGTKKQALAKCADLLAHLHAPVLGVVLNGADVKVSDYQYSKT